MFVGIDQLKDVIDKIINKPDDRRMIMCAWNPVDIPIMALPPCHALVQFYVANGELSCQLYQRSADMGLGVPFNIASYSLLTYMIAHIANLKVNICDWSLLPSSNLFTKYFKMNFQPGDFVHSMGDCHVYLNHVPALKEQVIRTPRPFPQLKITRQVKDIDDFKSSDFELEGYKPHPKIEMPMAV